MIDRPDEALEVVELRRLVTSTDFASSLRRLRTRRFSAALDLELRGNVREELSHILPALQVGADVDNGLDRDTVPMEGLRAAVYASLVPQPVSATERAAQLLVSALTAYETHDFPRAAIIGRALSELTGSAATSDLERLALESWALLLQGKFAGLRNRLTPLLGIDRAPDSARLTLARSPENMTYLALLTALALWIEGRLGQQDAPMEEALLLLERAAELALEQGLREAFLHCSRFRRALATSQRQRPSSQLEGQALPAEYVSELDLRIQQLWPSQSTAIEQGVLRQDSAVISMPTSAGKTLLAEMRIARDILENPEGLSVYLAPYNALARQVAENIRQGLGAMSGVRVELWTGAYELDLQLYEQLGEVQLPRVLVMTPEKFDSLVRSAGSRLDTNGVGRDLVDRLSLAVIDEAHLLGREQRGPKLEMILLRFRGLFPNVPIFALSAALTNVNDVATWFGIGEPYRITWRPTESWEGSWTPDARFQVRGGGSFGPIPRPGKQYLAGARLAGMIREQFRPILILETERRRAEKAATAVLESETESLENWRSNLRHQVATELDEAVRLTTEILGADHPLASLLRVGVAYHHAGVPPQLRARMEDLVRAGGIHTLAATTTLAEGIDLPFRAVVIPSLYFQQTPIPKDLYLNIVGRAGRAGFASEGCVVTVESEASSRYLRRELWNDRIQIAVAGQLGVVARSPRTVDDFQQVWEADSQLLGLLGDRATGDIKTESEQLARESFTGRTRVPAVRHAVERFFERRLENIVEHGLARAASPIQLTSAGEAVRWTGLSGQSGVRLRRYLNQPGARETVLGLGEARILSPVQARFISRGVSETGEVLSNLLAVRFSKEGVSILARWDANDIDLNAFEDLIAGDVELLTRWLVGDPLGTLQGLAPRRSRGRFSGDEQERLLDLVEHLSRVSGPAAWSWSALVTLLAAEHEDEQSQILQAGWAGSAIEFGVSNRPAITLCEDFGLSREKANRLGNQLLEAESTSYRAEDIHEFLSQSPEVGLRAGLELSEIEALLE
jgi:hypothetical protein